MVSCNVASPCARAVPVLFLALATACASDQPRALAPPPGPPSHPVTIHEPERLRGVATDERDASGRPRRAACVVCHSLRRPQVLPSSMSELREFHQGLLFDHGQQPCAACHVVGDQSSLHLSDGRLVPMTDAIALCRQCHGPQARNYDHGAHGGMTGFWDLSRGPRTRNHCVDCHDPHRPRFEPSQPVLPPRDIGLVRHAAPSKMPARPGAPTARNR
ncbi:MAG: hypothetical protein R3B48_14225 [Kofleriaceae bacterium]